MADETLSARGEEHPYLSGNFAPVRTQLPLTDCKYIGHIPQELLGGQYVRNGGNPAVNAEASRPAHWFDVRQVIGSLTPENRV